MISGVSKVVLYVDDQEAAKDFWTSKIGYELAQDSAHGSERWIEIAPPDNVRLVLSARHNGRPSRRDVPPELPHSDVMFHCDDLDSTYRELSSRGVTFPQPPVEQPWGWWAMFEDHEGTRYALGRRER